MNSLLTGFGNTFLNASKALTNPTSTPAAAPMAQPNLLLQAFGAAIRGEDPHVWLQNLAKQHPQLQQYDFSNLQATAQQVCQQNNVNMQDMINRIDNAASPLIK